LCALLWGDHVWRNGQHHAQCRSLLHLSIYGNSHMVMVVNDLPVGVGVSVGVGVGRGCFTGSPPCSRTSLLDEAMWVTCMHALPSQWALAATTQCVATLRLQT
jgi:hypothetical protein